MNARPFAISTALAALLAIAAPAFASDKDDVLTIVNQFNDDGNKQDPKSAAALCADQTLIIDMFAPYTWSGPGACSEWMKAGDAYGKTTGISDGVVTFEDTAQVVVTGDGAYAAMPATFTYKANGKPASSPLRSIWTYTLQKRPGGWRITGLSWGLK